MLRSLPVFLYVQLSLIIDVVKKQHKYSRWLEYDHSSRRRQLGSEQTEELGIGSRKAGGASRFLLPVRIFTHAAATVTVGITDTDFIYTEELRCHLEPKMVLFLVPRRSFQIRVFHFLK